MKKFISIIWGYHKQIFLFDKEENYHMLPIQAMGKLGYTCEIYALDSKVKIESDPNFIPWTKVIYYSNFFKYLIYLFKNRSHLIYSNSITLRSLIVSLIGKTTVFCPHSYPFWSTKIKKIIILFFYYFFTKIRVNNLEEKEKINKIKKNLALKLPLSISKSFFYKTDFLNKKNQLVRIWNLTPIKNPLFLIEIGKIIKQYNLEVKIIIIWEDRMQLFQRESFKTLISKNKLEDIITLKWVLSHNQIQSILIESKFYINTSISEGQCLAVYEASLAWCYLFLPRIMAFRSVFNNVTYFDQALDVFKKLKLSLYDKGINEQIKFNQDFILEHYNYTTIEKEFQCAMLDIH